VPVAEKPFLRPASMEPTFSRGAESLQSFWLVIVDLNYLVELHQIEHLHDVGAGVAELQVNTFILALLIQNQDLADHGRSPECDIRKVQQ
jgi:hypothetical protein